MRRKFACFRTIIRCVITLKYPLQDLHGQRFVALGQNDPYAQRLTRIFERYDVIPVTVVEVHNSIMAAEAVAQGVGVSVINPFSALSFKHRAVTFRTFSENLPFTSTMLRSKFQPTSALLKAFETSLLETRDSYLRDIKDLVGN